MLSSSRMPRPSFTSSIGRGDAHSTCSGLPCLPSSPTVGFTTQLGPPIVATSGRSARHSAKPFTAGGAARHSAVLGLAPLSGPGEGEQHPASAARRLDIGGPVPSAPLVLAPVCPPDGAPPTPAPDDTRVLVLQYRHHRDARHDEVRRAVPSPCTIPQMGDDGDRNRRRTPGRTHSLCRRRLTHRRTDDRNAAPMARWPRRLTNIDSRLEKTCRAWPAQGQAPADQAHCASPGPGSLRLL